LAKKGRDSNLWLDEIDSHIIRALADCRQSTAFKDDLSLIWKLYSQHLTAVRPLLLLPSLSCEWCGSEGSNATAVAAAWSLYYLAARIQDDLADHAAPREISSKEEDLTTFPETEGKVVKSLSFARLSNLATGLIFAASQSLLRIEFLPLKERLTLQKDFMRTGLQVCLAQHEDLSETTSWQAKEQKLAKAGAALALACRAGARVAGANRQDTIALSDFGNSLGLILKLQDDFHDLWKEESSTDLRQGRFTFPLLFAMRLANGLSSQRLQQLVAQVSDDTSVEPEAKRVRALRNDTRTEELRTLIAAVGSLHYWVLVVERCQQAAQSQLATRIAPLSAKRALLSLMNSMVPWESACDGASPTLLAERKYGRAATGHDYGNGMRMPLRRQSASIYV
jgi:geranylgeranyl pyrophosphate synthase